MPKCTFFQALSSLSYTLIPITFQGNADHKIIRSISDVLGMQAAKIIYLTDKAFYTVCYFTVKVSSVLTQCQVVYLLK